MGINREEEFADKTVKEIFTLIYQTSNWKSSDDIDSISGQGSTLKYTKNIRKELPKIIKELKIKNILDCGCGDLKWTSELLHSFESYLGIDIVNDLIFKNSFAYKDFENINFQVEDIINYIPKANIDTVLIKDVLVHLKNDQILTFLKNLRKSNVKYLIATNFTVISKNNNLKVPGTWRPINLSLSPFNLGTPIKIIREPSEAYCFENTCFNDKTLSIWRLK